MNYNGNKQENEFTKNKWVDIWVKIKKNISFHEKKKSEFLLIYKVMRGIFGPRREEVKGEWRRLHNEELNDLYLVLSRRSRTW